ncbi:MAG: hypothetical protein ACXW2E_01780 [Nitrososphaeraceae archaeon]
MNGTELTTPYTVQIQIIDKPNKNKRIYPKELIQNLIIQYRDKDIRGTIGIPNSFSEWLDENSSHIIRNLRIEEDYLVGDVTILDTPLGSILSSILDKMDFRLVGCSKYIEDDTSNTVDPTNYVLLGICAVGNGA